MTTQVEELPENRVRLNVEVPPQDVKHAVEHAASDLSASVKIPGFRKGKVPLPVLFARVGKERVYAEAIESHIGDWYRSAAVESRIRPVERPDFDFELPQTDREPFRFSATVAVQPRPEPADWTSLEVPRANAEVPAELLDQELEQLRYLVAERVPVEGRAAQPLDTVVIDLVAGGESQRDVAVDLGGGQLVEEIEEALVGLEAGQTKTIEYELDDETTRKVELTLKEIREPKLPPLDDDLSKAASEFETLEELRGDLEARLREQLEVEIESVFREAAVDRLVDASRVEAGGPLVDSRARELLTGLERSLGARGISLETYLTVSGEDPKLLVERLRSEAERSVARELVLEAVADRLGLVVSDEDLRAFIRDQVGDAAEEGESPEVIVDRVWEGPAREQLREDLRLRAALDRVAAEVRPISTELAAARDRLWTPEKGESARETKLWTPGD